MKIVAIIVSSALWRMLLFGDVTQM